MHNARCVKLAVMFYTKIKPVLFTERGADVSNVSVGAPGISAFRCLVHSMVGSEHCICAGRYKTTNMYVISGHC